MIRDLWLIGIGTGSPSHVTLEGVQAIRDAATILVPHKGPAKDALAEVRHRIIHAAHSRAQVVPFDYPVRDPELPYQTRVHAWHDEIARRWQDALADTAQTGPVALLVWGDPSLYDSTIRIAERLTPRPKVRIVPGITAIQALTAAYAAPLNTVNGPVHITTGRRLRSYGWPDGAETVVVMLDSECSFLGLNMPDLTVLWGAYLGTEDEILCHGRVAEVGDEIVQTRDAARARHGWIMDTYLLRKTAEQS